MAATFHWVLSYGGTETIVASGGASSPVPGADESGANADSSVSGINFLSADTGERVGGNGTVIQHYDHPIRAGNNSFERYVRGYWVFDTGTNKVTGMRLWVNNNSEDAGAITIYGRVSGGYAAPSTNSNANASLMPTTEAGALQLDPDATLSGSGFSKYAVLQMRTTSSAPPGDTEVRTFTFQYDEQ